MVAAFVTQATGAKGPAAPLTIDVHDLVQHWSRASEEERADGAVQIFRPAASTAFPPSRFRMAYTFSADGRCELYVLSPDDAHYFKGCTWTVSGRDRATLRIVTDDATTVFRIVALSPTMLRLAPLPPPRSQ